VDNVSVRDLRNHGGQILDRVAAGEAMTITRDGTPVAHLTPLPAPRLNAEALIERWRGIPVLDATELRDDIAEIVDLDL
jgi:prevent-host-death family protein